MERCGPGAAPETVDEAAAVLKSMEHTANGRSGLVSLLGHKGDLMLIHFRDSFDALNEVELALAQLQLAPFLAQTTSYLSVVELGLYSASGQLYGSLREKDIAPGTPEWKEQVEAYLAQAPADHGKGGSGPTSPPGATSASIPWTRSGARRRTGTTRPSPSASA